MAITSNNPEETQEQASPTAGTGAQPGAEAAPGSDRQAPIFSTMISDFTTASGLGTEATAYVDEIRKILGDKSRRTVIEMKQLGQPSGSVLFFTKDCGIILLFEEAIRDLGPQIPKAAAIGIAAGECKRQMGDNFRILNIITVDRYSYNKAIAMANHITVIMEADLTPGVKSFRIEDMAKTKFTVDNDINNVHQFVMENSPHAISSRGDIGFTINMKHDGPDQYYGMGQRPQDRYVPVMGCTAYVEIIKRQDEFQGGQVRFQPLIHITEITSIIPSAKVFPIIMAVAADIFIGRGMWKNQFNQFEPGKPNIGNLVEEEPGKPWFARSVKDREEFINAYVDKPALALDVTEGRARIPGIEKYTNPVFSNEITNEYSEFLGVQIDQSSIPCTPVYTEVVGIIEQGSRFADSREVDYLTTIQHLASNPRIAELLVRSKDLNSRADLIQELMSNFNRLYINQVVVFDAAMIEALGMHIAKVLNLMVNFDTMNNIDMGVITNQAAAFGGGVTGVTSSMGYNRGNWNQGPYAGGNIYG